MSRLRFFALVKTSLAYVASCEAGTALQIALEQLITYQGSMTTMIITTGITKLSVKGEQIRKY
jgi:hypothetical protein